MYKIIYLFLIAFVITSCEENNDSPFLYIPDSDAQFVEMSVETSTSANLVFSPIVRASQMVINWGDGSRLIEYVDPDSSASPRPLLKPLRYTFPSAGNYMVDIRAIRIIGLDVSMDTARQSITQLKLNSCRHLKEFSCRGQALKTIEIARSGLKVVNFSDLAVMENFSISQCDSLSSVVLKDNMVLNTIFLSGNPLLSATAINAIFQQLPSATSDVRTITLSNNAGDATCDKTIATQKGWTVTIE